MQVDRSMDYEHALTLLNVEVDKCFQELNAQQKNPASDPKQVALLKAKFAMYFEKRESLPAFSVAELQELVVDLSLP